MNARDFFTKKYGDTKLGVPMINFAEAYHTEKVRDMKVTKFKKRHGIIKRGKGITDESE